MKLSIIIPVWLVKKPAPIPEQQLLDFTVRTIDSIKLNCPIPYEIIIVDNGSEFGTEYLKSVATKYIRNEENKGFAPAVNWGIEAASGDWIVQSNNDIILKEGTIQAMIDAFKLPDVGVVMPTPWAEGMLNDPTTEYLYNQPFGAFWMMRPETLKEVARIQKEKFGLVEKPLDENYKFGMFEDSDMWLILQEYLKKQVVRLRNKYVFHQGNATWGSLEGKEKIFLDNQAYYKQKHNK